MEERDLFLYLSFGLAVKLTIILEVHSLGISIFDPKDSIINNFKYQHLQPAIMTKSLAFAKFHRHASFVEFCSLRVLNAEVKFGSLPVCIMAHIHFTSI